MSLSLHPLTTLKHSEKKTMVKPCMELQYPETLLGPGGPGSTQRVWGRKDVVVLYSITLKPRP